MTDLGAIVVLLLAVPVGVGVLLAVLSGLEDSLAATSVEERRTADVLTPAAEASTPG